MTLNDHLKDILDKQTARSKEVSVWFIIEDADRK